MPAELDGHERAPTYHVPDEERLDRAGVATLQQRKLAAMLGAVLASNAFYRDKYDDLMKDAEAGFRTLFGDAFARAYEEHLERLQPSGRSPGQ